jgi:hypothetical protein
MHKLITVLATIVIGSVLLVSNATASPSSDALGACMADHTTGKDRKDMARWIFVTMSVHPALQDISKVSKNDMNDVDMLMGAMVTKLLTEDCAPQAKKAMDEGTESFKAAFSVVGQLAMQELMNNPGVQSSLSGFTKYINKDKLNAVFSKK